MSENPKKNTSRQLFRGVMKNKKNDCDDIVTQAENIVTDYIYKRKNEIINKYCQKHIGVRSFMAFLALSFGMCVLYFVLNQ